MTRLASTFTPGDTELTSRKYALRLRCGATECAAMTSCAAVTALMTRSALATASATFAAARTPFAALARLGALSATGNRTSHADEAGDAARGEIDGERLADFAEPQQTDLQTHPRLHT